MSEKPGNHQRVVDALYAMDAAEPLPGLHFSTADVAAGCRLPFHVVDNELRVAEMLGTVARGAYPHIWRVA